MGSQRGQTRLSTEHTQAQFINNVASFQVYSKVILGKKKKRTVRKLLTENIYSNPIVLEEMLISLVN